MLAIASHPADNRHSCTKPHPPMLNPQQRTADGYGAGPPLVLASAGSGKTRVILEKVTWVVPRDNTPPRHIARTTSTSKAAHATREWIARRVRRGDDEAMHGGTFHAPVVKFLQAAPTRCGLRRGFSVPHAGARARREVTTVQPARIAALPG